MITESVPIESVRPDPANVRRHGDRNLDAIRQSLDRFGQQKPIVVDADGIVRAGNGTLMAAHELGWHTIQVVRSGLSGDELAAYAIADNRSADLAEWDNDSLLAALQDLAGDPGLLEAAGYTADELEALAGLFDVDPAGMPELADGDREPFQQMTFVVADEQAELIREAIEAAKGAGDFDKTINENSNGNALTRIAEAYLQWAMQSESA